jgi:hypothetical protein
MRQELNSHCQKASISYCKQQMEVIVPAIESCSMPERRVEAMVQRWSK